MKTTVIIVTCLITFFVSAQDLKIFESKTGKFGYLDSSGKQVIPAVYQEAYRFKHGLGLVMLNDKWGYIDNTGRKIISLKYDAARSFEDGFAAVNIGATR